ncbi:MAG: DUF1572 family protein [Bryobacterales bacterium]|nr:DUF1572 family protein [Bryobacterales bacterium]MCZ2151131.1 DUF1572 domain-containing protein [Bryobacterales bacterium]
MENELAALFLGSAARRMAQYMDRIRISAGRLTEEQIWTRGSGNENAVGNLLLHLAGNVRQWIVSGVGGAADVRKRDTEFAAAGDIPKAGMLATLQSAVDEAVAVIEAQSPGQLAEKVTIQGHEISKLEAIFHVVEHFALHTGQIMYATKLFTHEDLGFYGYLGSKTHGRKTP